MGRKRTWRDALTLSSADFYAMADLAIARRIGSALWFGGALIAAILLPFAPPDNSSAGAAGWVIAAAIVIFALAYSVRLLRFPAGVGANEILALNYVAVALIAILMWLNGDDAPYAELLLLSTLYTAAVHPPRRTLAFLGAILLALGSPLLYGAEGSVSEELSRLLIWGGLATAATAYTARVRLQRADLLEEGSEARSEARADPLTSLGNRRAFDEALAAAGVRASRSGHALSVIIADLDSFKAINDEYGLPEGDRCLRDVAEVLRETVREPDSCFRWGGDEFVVVVDVDRRGADRLAARLAEAVSGRCRRPDGDPIQLHVGTAELDSRGAADPAALLAAASMALKPDPAEPG